VSVSDPGFIWRLTAAVRTVRVLRTHGDNVTDPGFPIYRRPPDEELEGEATSIHQDVVDAVDAFKRFTSEESRDLLAAGRDDEDAD
jgi:hypothetical protein